MVILLLMVPVLAVAAGIVVLTRVVRPRLPRLFGAGLVVLGIALVPMIVRWDDQACWDTGDPCGGLLDAVPAFWFLTSALLIAWLVAVVAAPAFARIRHGKDARRS